MNTSTLFRIMRNQKPGSICSMGEIEEYSKDKQFTHLVVLTWRYTEITTAGRVIERSCHKKIEAGNLTVKSKAFTRAMAEARGDMA